MQLKQKAETPKLGSLDKCLAFSLENIIRYGDTDIFPYPIERQIFKDKKDDIIKLLESINGSFDELISQMPLEHEKLLNSVGYTGFRQGTQIDSIWNAYLLGLVIFIGNDIEKSRISTSNDNVFSYRFKPDMDDHTIFDKDFGWLAFQKHSIQQASKFKFVLTCDISDFYPHIYHHRLENALKKTTRKSEVIKQIKYLLNGLSGGVSYGLPIGGPAARLLSELLLNRTDKLLVARGISFCRFVDDYHIFGNSKEEMYANLIYLSETLLNNEGLTIQKTKTRILSSGEFLETSTFSDSNIPEDGEEKNKRDFLSIHIHYDPYSDTADEDYETLCDELGKFDIVGMLASEMQKTRVQEGLTRKLIKAIGHIDENVKNPAVLSLLENLYILYPIFTTVMILLVRIIDDLNDNTRQKVFAKLRELLETQSYICQVPVNLAFAVRVLSYDNSDETDTVLIKVFMETTSMMIKRDIILILAKHNADYWVSNQLKRFNTATPWEKRALLISSYILEDEGKEWRKRIKSSLSPFDKLVLTWASEHKANGKGLEI
ncbi:RNA-directed DNA polymerase [Geomonas azotofigens]|uniref:RNA-directed DNA polymerase n=1 Tax=Geomonas azotofigens TaxID=2843196 RepID=UPI001C109A75|nr:RNA-directed DNA polymerase [Geomonas azotofigens]MBU5613225.1 RNA-directed DNA polymerase [Geomonas azotofigens]